MKVLLVNPPWLRPGWYGVRAGSRWPHMERAEAPYMPFPFLMGYAAAVLRDDGVEVEVIDACAERIGHGEFLKRFEQASPDVVVAEISTPSFHGDMRCFQGMRDLGFDGPILAAGIHKPLYEPSFLDGNPLIDGALVGEYELTVRDFVRAGGSPDSPIPGLNWRVPGGVLEGGRKHSQEGLDEFPWPAREYFPMDCYHDLPGGIPAPSVQLWGSRGCSFTCNFCAWPQILYGDNAYRTRSADRVAEEVLAMKEQGYESVYFDDDTFNLGKKRTSEIARAFQEHGVNMPWAFMGRADTCDPKQYEALAATGLQAVKYGVESSDSARLKQIGKNLDIDRVRESVAMVHSLGIKVHLTFMFGLQGETLDTMQRTLDLAYELDPDSAQFTVAVPFPGSRLHEELQESGRLDGLEFEDLDGYRTGVVSTDALQAEQIIAFVHGVHRRWEGRSRPAGVAPKIPVSEIGGSTVSIGLIAQAGESDWLRAALEAVLAQEGPSREVVVVADPSDPSLETTAAEVCDWVTFVDSEPGESGQAMANRVAEQCTGMWLAFLQGGALPRPGWLEGILAATKRHPHAGALAFATYRQGENGTGSALSVSRWGRVLPHSGVTGGPDQDVFAVSSRAGVFSRALLEEAGGFDSELPLELADADLALRGLILGYRSLLVEDGAVDLSDGVGLVHTDSQSVDSEAVRSWARGRIRMLLTSVPRESFEGARVTIALELLADIFRAAREGRHPLSVMRGFVEGVGHRKAALDRRKRVLGRRRVGERFVRDAFADSEADMAHCNWQRVLQSITA
ncbi:MAG: radical SAM protein [Myxococcota bacterium]|nr:radical SAM protein [Myxococcota bacterium]